MVTRYTGATMLGSLEASLLFLILLLIMLVVKLASTRSHCFASTEKIGNHLKIREMREALMPAIMKMTLTLGAPRLTIVGPSTIRLLSDLLPARSEEFARTLTSLMKKALKMIEQCL